MISVLIASETDLAAVKVRFEDLFKMAWRGDVEN